MKFLISSRIIIPTANESGPLRTETSTFNFNPFASGTFHLVFSLSCILPVTILLTCFCHFKTYFELISTATFGVIVLFSHDFLSRTN